MPALPGHRWAGEQAVEHGLLDCLDDGSEERIKIATSRLTMATPRQVGFPTRPKRERIQERHDALLKA
jgi:hypothetical protein